MLHLSYRKKQQEKITNENSSFAQRLMTQYDLHLRHKPESLFIFFRRPLFDKKQYDHEYEKHRNLMKQMQKMGPSQKLPPLQQDQREKKVKNAKVLGFK